MAFAFWLLVSVMMKTHNHTHYPLLHINSFYCPLSTVASPLVMGDTIPKVSIALIRYFLKWVLIPLTFSSDTDTIMWFIKCQFSKAGELVLGRRSNIKPKNVNILLFLNLYTEKLHHLNLTFVVSMIKCNLIWFHYVININSGIVSYRIDTLLRVLSIVPN